MPADQQRAPRDGTRYEESGSRAGGHAALDGPGLAGDDAPGKRSGHGIGSVMDQMQKDQQRNANQSDGDDDLPSPARDSTA
jgi:hypothetical protein